MSPYKRATGFLWRSRWQWFFVPAVVVFSLFFWVVPESNPTDGGASVQGTKLVLSLAMALLVGILFSVGIAVLHAFSQRRHKWMLAVLVFPPLSLVYYFKGAK